MASTRPPIEHYLTLEYPYSVVPDDGSFFIKFPDLPGCMTQVEDTAEIGAVAEEIRILWLRTTYDQGLPIPEPAVQSEYSGKFVVRVPKQLHKELATAARQQNMSLNAYVTYLLSSRTISAETNARLERIEQCVSTMNEQSPYHVDRERQRASAPTRQSKPIFKLVAA